MDNKPLDKIMSDMAMTVLLEKASNISRFYEALGSNIDENTKMMLLMWEFYPDQYTGMFDI